MTRFALYEGNVVDRDDPEGRARIRVLIPGILDPVSDWIRPIGLFDSANGRGVFFVPQVGANIEVMFLHGDESRASSVRYLTGPWGKPAGVSDVPSEAEGGNPDIVVFAFNGFAMVVDERQGQRKATLLDRQNGSFFRFDIETGDILLQSAKKVTIAGRDSNAKLELEPDGTATMTGIAKAIMTGTLMEVGLGAKEAAVLGTAFAMLYNSHTQPVTMAGAGPPIVPMVPGTHTSLVTKIK